MKYDDQTMDKDFILTNDEKRWGALRVGGYYRFIVDGKRHTVAVSGLDYNILIEMFGRNVTYDEHRTINMTQKQYAMFLLKKDNT